MCVRVILPHSTTFTDSNSPMKNWIQWNRISTARLQTKRSRYTLFLSSAWRCFACAVKKRCRLNYYGHRQSTHSKSFLFTPLVCVRVLVRPLGIANGLCRVVSHGKTYAFRKSREKRSLSATIFPARMINVCAPPWLSLYVCVCGKS